LYHNLVVPQSAQSANVPGTAQTCAGPLASIPCRPSPPLPRSKGLAPTRVSLLRTSASQRAAGKGGWDKLRLHGRPPDTASGECNALSKCGRKGYSCRGGTTRMGGGGGGADPRKNDRHCCQVPIMSDADTKVLPNLPSTRGKREASNNGSVLKVSTETGTRYGVQSAKSKCNHI
jgi:hypothetical protein